MSEGNRQQDQHFTAPGGEPEQAAMFYAPPSVQGRSTVAAVIERNRADIAKIPGVHGLSEGRTATGDPAVRIDIEDDTVRAQLPKEIDGYLVETFVVHGGFGILPAR